jgi:hypothetical protein
MKKWMVATSIVGTVFLSSFTFAGAEAPIPSTKVNEYVLPSGIHVFSMVDVITAVGREAHFDQDKKEFVAQFDKETIRIPLMPTQTVYINDKETILTFPVFVDKKGDHAVIYAPRELFDKAGIALPNTLIIEIGKSEPQKTSQEQPKQEYASQQVDGKAIIGTPENPAIVINGILLQTDTSPVLNDNHVLVPLRAIFEGLGGTVNWYAEDRTITGKIGDAQINMSIDNDKALVNGQTVTLDTPSKIINDKTFVPLRFVGESAGAKVDWDQQNYRVTIKNDK